MSQAGGALRGQIQRFDLQKGQGMFAISLHELLRRLHAGDVRCGPKDCVERAQARASSLRSFSSMIKSLLFSVGQTRKACACKLAGLGIGASMLMSKKIGFVELKRHDSWRNCIIFVG